MKVWQGVAAALAIGAVLALGPARAEPAAQGAAGEVRLSPRQVQALGIVAQAVSSQPAAPPAGYPARVVVPPTQQRVVSAPLAGVVEQLRVAVGDTVQAGQTLAVVRSLPAQELQREVLQARSQAELGAKALARDEQLYGEGLIAASRLEATRAAQQQAQALAAERARALALAGGRADGELVLASPIAGAVMEVGVSIGQRIDAAAPVARVARLAPLWLELQVPAAEAATLAVGDAVGLAGAAGLAGGSGAAVPARILRLGHAVEPATQTVLVRAELAGAAAARVRPGQLVEVQVARAASDQRLLPAAAVVRQGGAAAVFVEQAAGRYRLVPVTVVSSAGSGAGVRGLPPGARVVVQGTAALLPLAQP
ncbi:MAG: efflux RND transporter periplasmic adaptor subunit [Burkholderiales bacterium]|nr:efflux RND transporter periplasmic adaptor subunit [Burkholderiales bacterium]MDE2564427.1 efflux RND transporter periplasmic adaptor subunit [Burkholderiales bacterium]